MGGSRSYCSPGRPYWIVRGLVAVGHTAVPAGHTGWGGRQVAVGHIAVPVGHTGRCVGWWQ